MEFDLIRGGGGITAGQSTGSGRAIGGGRRHLGGGW